MTSTRRDDQRRLDPDAIAQHAGQARAAIHAAKHTEEHA